VGEKASNHYYLRDFAREASQVFSDSGGVFFRQYLGTISQSTSRGLLFGQ
jgi:hypothetical protein